MDQKLSGKTHPDNSNTDVKSAVDRALEEAGLALVRDGEGVYLTDGTMSLRADFAHMASRIKPGALQRELLVRAAKIKHADGRPTAIDATAGLGEDSLLLAAAGFEVTLYERNPVIAALLKDALDRASTAPSVPGLADAVSRMHVVEGDSMDALDALEVPPDVVFLDPMFPTKQKSSSVKKKLQLLQRLEQPCDDEAALLDAALATHARKVVVKRPVKGPALAGRKPAYSLGGKAVRFDCYV